MLQVSISRIMSKIEGNLFFKYTFQVRETLSPMFALRQKYLEYFLRWYLNMQLFRISAGMAHKSEYLECFLIWYHFIQAKASPSRITTRKIPPKKAPTESEELELETGHGFGVVGSVEVVGSVVGVVEVASRGISVELFVVVMGSAVDVVASVVAFAFGVVGASIVAFVVAVVVAFVVAVVVASIVAFAFGVVGAFAIPLLVVVSAAKAQKKKVRRILLTGIVDG